MFIGVPVYMDRGDYIFQTTGPFYTSWVADEHDSEWYLNKIISENQGNLVVLWDGGATKYQLKAAAAHLALEDIGISIPEPDWENGKYLVPNDFPPIAEHFNERCGAGFHKFVKQAANLGLFVYSMYTDANAVYTEKIVSEKQFIGYNAGEAFAFRLDPKFGADEKTASTFTLETAADGFRNSIKQYFQTRRDNGWDTFLVTSGSFHVDFEIASGGNDVIPHIEGFAFRNLNFGMSLCRGIYKQCSLPLWGCYLAHEHYAYLPYDFPQRWQGLDAAYYLAYMNGSKVSVQECGSWWQQSDHIPDTPMHKVPKFDAGDISINNPHDYKHLVKEARKHYPAIGYDSEVCKKYRKSVSDFYNYIKENGTPEGQPEITFAALKGRYDFCSAEYSPNSAIASAYPVAEHNLAWFENHPEKSWQAFRNAIFPENNSFTPYRNAHFTGTPYGLCDIVSFAAPLTAEYLINNYKVLMFAGWHSAKEEDYNILKEYVAAGGILFLSIAHLSKNIKRNFISYSKDELVNNGDFSELCGVKIKGRGTRYYWALMQENNPIVNSSTSWRTKYGVLCTHLGDIEITDDIEILATDDEQFKPLLISHKYGKGEVIFLNSWEYPGALDANDAPGARTDDIGFPGQIYKYMAKRARGNVYITDDYKEPGINCKDITFSYFPSNNKVYMMNCNFTEKRQFILHFLNREIPITLNPHEFKIFGE